MKYFKNLINELSKEEIEQKYVAENLSQVDCCTYFDINQGMFNRLLRYYKIHKPKDGHIKLIKQSKEDRFGDPNYNNRDKAKETCIERLGVENPFQDTENIKRSYIEKLGVDHPMHKEEIKQKVISKINYEETIKKGRKTYEEKTGYSNPAKNPEVIKAGIITKINNGVYDSPNHSRYEERVVAKLKDLYGKDDIEYPYRDERYARQSGYEFECDVYIRSLDLFIELNKYPTHLTYLYTGSDEDIEVINMLTAEDSKWANKTIETWRDRDSEKFRVAKENKLNYIMLYPDNTLEYNIQLNGNKYENIIKTIYNIK